MLHLHCPLMQWCLPSLWHLLWQSPLSVQPPDKWESKYQFSHHIFVEKCAKNTERTKRKLTCVPSFIYNLLCRSRVSSNVPIFRCLYGNKYITNCSLSMQNASWLKRENERENTEQISGIRVKCKKSMTVLPIQIAHNL